MSDPLAPDWRALVDQAAGRVVAEIGGPKTMRQIAAEIANTYGLTLVEITGPNRARIHAWPRQEAMAAIYATGRFSLPQIGRLFQRDHTTVLAAIRAVKARAGQSAGVAA